MVANTTEGMQLVEWVLKRYTNSSSGREKKLTPDHTEVVDIEEEVIDRGKVYFSPEYVHLGMAIQTHPTMLLDSNPPFRGAMLPAKEATLSLLEFLVRQGRAEKVVVKDSSFYRYKS